jgi:NADH-quinone oxidoreductase subunit H
MDVIKVAFFVLVFPGFLFQFVMAAVLEWVDRKLYARMQNRVGPLYTGQSGFLQPVADLVKLFAKEDLTPAAADKFMFNLMPLVSLAAVCASGLLVPLWVIQPYTSFPGDIIVDAYLLSIPTFALFLAGWFSSSPFSLIGASRVLTQMFAYEVPFFLADHQDHGIPLVGGRDPAGAPPRDWPDHRLRRSRHLPPSEAGAGALRYP